MASEYLRDALALAELLKPAWAEISAGIPAWHPRCEDPPADPPDDPPSDDPPADDPPADDPPSEPDWKAESRKHERRAKQSAKDLAAVRAELDEIKKGQQTDQEKALEEARKQARDEALTEAQKERRADRLEVAITRLAAKGVKVGTGEDAKTLRFADPEDAQVFIERAINRGELDADDIFNDEGKVQTDALTTALADLLERKPNLAADNGAGRAGGSSDAGRGSGSKSLDEMSVEEHLKRIQKG